MSCGVYRVFPSGITISIYYFNLLFITIIIIILMNLSRVMYRMTRTQDMISRLPVLNGASGRGNCMFNEQEQSAFYN
jgi:hypothetical protein